MMRYIRSPVRTALMFAIPLLLAGIFTIVFSGGGAEGIRIRIFLYDEDQGLISRFIQGAAGSAEADEHLEIIPVGEEGYQRMENGEASALVHIPEHFSENLLRGKPVTLAIVKNPSQRFLPQIVEEGTSLVAVILSQGSIALRSELDMLTGMFDADQPPADTAISSLSVAISHKMQDLEHYLFPPAIQLESVTLKETEELDTNNISILSYFLPGLSIFGILFLAQSATRDILRDREKGLLRHLLSAPVTIMDYITGKCLSVIIVTLTGFIILVGIGLAAGASWGHPLGTILLVISGSLGMSGTLMLIMNLVRTERQGDTLTTIIIIVWGLLGGAFIPASQIPGFLLPVSRTTLTYWASDGFLKLIAEGASPGDILLNVIVLAAAGIVFMIAGATLLRRKLISGAL